VTAEPTTIELGVLPPGTADEEELPGLDAPWPGWSRLRRAASRRVWWTTAAVTVLLMLTTGAAAAPRPPWLVPHFTVPTRMNGDVWPQVSDQVLYVNEFTNTAQLLTAYRLSDGALLWQAAEASLWYDLPVRFTYQVTGDGLPREETIALDPDTGWERWSAPGGPAAVADGMLLLSRELPEPDPRDGPLPAGEQRPYFALTAVDRDTGHEVWSLPSVHLHSYAYDGSGLATRLVTLDRDGQLTSYDVGSGDPVATVSGAAGSGTADPSVTGDLVLIRSPVDSLVTAYDVETLALRWRIDVAVDIVDIVSCGPVICLNLTDGRPQAIDPATGELVWSATWSSSEPYYGYQPGPPWPSEFILMNTWVVDARTGEPVIDLGEWTPAYPGWASPSSVDTPGVMLTRHERRSGRETGFTWFAQLDPDAPRIDVLGGVPDDGSGCFPDFRLVVCPARGEVHVWRTRSADGQ
jgi:outer membrane protein assembly factor BamB